VRHYIAIAAACCALTLAGCIDSARPVLTDAKPLLGQHLHLQFYSLHKGFAEEPEQADYVWNGAYYAHAAGGMKDITGFTVHPFESGDYIVQTKPEDPKAKIEYALLHVFVDGVYQAILIDEDDADAAVRAANCRKDNDSSCRIETRAQLWALARATAARRQDRGGLAIRLPVEK